MFLKFRSVFLSPTPRAKKSYHSSIYKLDSEQTFRLSQNVGSPSNNLAARPSPTSLRLNCDSTQD